MRLEPRQKSIIDRAAELLGISRTAFILENVLPQAQTVIMEKTDIVLSPEKWDALAAALDAPIHANDRLKKLLSEPAPWEIVR